MGVLQNIPEPTSLRLSTCKMESEMLPGEALDVQAAHMECQGFRARGGQWRRGRKGCHCRWREQIKQNKKYTLVHLRRGA
jgi:hypothetical protein